jgi:FtsZ-interacting cell division protein ZipA
MNATVWIVIAVAVVVLLVVLWLVLRRSRNDRKTELRERFGPEYDRQVEQSGSEREAQKHLDEVRERRESLDIRPLQPAARDRYLKRWEVVQAEFVDQPGQAVDEADSLVSDAMRERGYPVDDFDSRAEMVAADHPEVVSDYRAASDARRRHHDTGGTASTEELRRAMVHYRSLFERLLSDPNGESQGRHVADDG